MKKQNAFHRCQIIYFAKLKVMDNIFNDLEKSMWCTCMRDGYLLEWEYKMAITDTKLDNKINITDKKERLSSKGYYITRGK